MSITNEELLRVIQGLLQKTEKLADPAPASGAPAPPSEAPATTPPSRDLDNDPKPKRVKHSKLPGAYNPINLQAMELAKMHQTLSRAATQVNSLQSKRDEIKKGQNPMLLRRLHDLESVLETLKSKLLPVAEQASDVLSHFSTVKEEPKESIPKTVSPPPLPTIPEEETHKDESPDPLPLRTDPIQPADRPRVPPRSEVPKPTRVPPPQPPLPEALPDERDPDSSPEPQIPPPRRVRIEPTPVVDKPRSRLAALWL
jgi:hypothetical protein